PSTHLRLYIFFYRARPLWHLHSFPTRRSSDLPGDPRAARLGPGDRLFAGPRVDVLLPASAGRLARRHGRARERARGGERADQRKDRKSTRLNSSHLGISYAVFCLKKKNST